MKTNKNKELLLEQLKKTPIIHLACERTGVGRASFYRWKNEDPIFAKQADEALAEGVMLMNDLAESKLLSSVKEGNLTGILFWLRNRHDAYKTRVEISSGQKDEVVITDEQEEIIKKAIGLSQIENRREEKE
jgi:hypothetical protein